MGTNRAFIFKDGKLSSATLATVAKLKGKAGVSAWIDLEDPGTAELKLLQKGFGFHHLAVENAMGNGQRCKVEEYGDFVFIVLRVFPKGECEASQLSMFLASNLLVTVHRKCFEAVEEVAETVKQYPAILGKGPDFIAYEIMDRTIDGIFPLLDKLEDEIDGFEDRMLKASSPQEVNATLGNLFDMKKQNLVIRKVVWPMRDVLTLMTHRDYKYVRSENTAYFRDAYDHMLRITDMTEMNREVLAASMEAYLAVISNNLNVVMKKLAAVAGIFAVPMLIGSIYGMNFQNMPELSYPYGYYIALGEMLLASSLMFAYFKISKWL